MKSRVDLLTPAIARISAPDAGRGCPPTGSRTSRRSVALAEHFTLLPRVENLFDEDYELASGYQTMGQAFFGALRYEFR